MRELEVLQRGGQPSGALPFTVPELDADDLDELDDAPEQEVEDAEARILDQATAARSIGDLKAEIGPLRSADPLDCFGVGGIGGANDSKPSARSEAVLAFATLPVAECRGYGGAGFGRSAVPSRVGDHNTWS